MRKLHFSNIFGVCALAVVSFGNLSARAEEGDLILTAEAEASVTNSAALGAVTRLIKRGGGEVVLTAATDAFTGEVLIEEGTLTITNLKALGKGTPLTVSDGAAFVLNTPRGAAQNTPLFTDHTITITGHGVNGTGAFRYRPTIPVGMTTTDCSDNLISSLILAGDASIDVSNRWGFYGGTSGVRLNGHTLTKVGGRELVFLSAGLAGPGKFIISSGTVTLQSDVKFDKTNGEGEIELTGGSTLNLWGLNNPLIFPLTMNGGTKINVGSGSRNTLAGPISLKEAGTVTLSGAAGKALIISGSLTREKGCDFTKQGDFDLHVTGDTEMESSSYLYGGSWIFSGEGERGVGLVTLKAGTLVVSGGVWRAQMLRVSNGSNSRAAFLQTGGEVFNGTDWPFIGESSGSCGYYVMEGGTASFSNDVNIARNDGSFGALIQKGGYFSTFRRSSSAVVYFGGVMTNSVGLFYQSGGTNDTRQLETGGRETFKVANGGGDAFFTVTGSNTLFKTDAFSIGKSQGSGTNVINLLNGAVFEARRFYRLTNDNNRVWVNADGGVMVPTFYSGFGHVDPTAAQFYKRAPDHFVIYEKGFTIDMSRCSNGTETVAGLCSFASSLEAPSGLGLATVSLPTDAAFQAQKYIGPALVRISGSGYGASAFADFDFSTKKLTGVIVTSAGCEYGDDTRVEIESPDRGTLYTCPFTLAPRSGGPFVKRGKQSLDLYGKGTWTGGTFVEEGQLRCMNTNSFPQGTDYAVAKDAVLNLNGKPLTVARLSGVGEVNGAAVTVTNTLCVSCADIFENRCLSLDKNLTFSTGTTIEITDPENLDGYKNYGFRPAVTAAGGIQGLPKLVSAGGEEVFPWRLHTNGANVLEIGFPIGTILLVQ